jgi:hypothetical protein
MFEILNPIRVRGEKNKVFVLVTVLVTGAKKIEQDFWDSGAEKSVFSRNSI